MHIDDEIIDAAAQLIAFGAQEGPIDDQAEASGLDERQTRILEDLLGSLVPGDLRTALRLAGRRLDEADYPSDDDEGDDTAEVVQPEEAEETPAAAVDLMAALKASLEQAKKAREGSN